MQYAAFVDKRENGSLPARRKRQRKGERGQADVQKVHEWQDSGRPSPALPRTNVNASDCASKCSKVNRAIRACGTTARQGGIHCRTARADLRVESLVAARHVRRWPEIELSSSKFLGYSQRMSFSRFHQRFVAWFAMLALVASSVAAPLAHALAMRDAVPNRADICSVAKKSTGTQRAAVFPGAPFDAGHAAHGTQCALCAGASPPAAISRPADTAIACVEGSAGLAWTAPETLHPRLPSRDGRPRAPPSLS